MEERQGTICPNCERLKERVATLEAQLAEALARIAKLEEKLARSKKDSSNSSKPPSSDIVKPPKASSSPGTTEPKRGAQKGHPRHERPAFAPEEINQVHDYHLDCCPGCGHALVPGDAAPKVIQQVEVLETPVRIEEHRGHAYWCPNCQVMHYASLPPAVQKGGLVGPRLTALVAYMKGFCHASFSTIRKFLRDVAQVTISRGQLAKLIAKVSDGLARSYEQLRENLATQAYLNVDETGHKDNGARYWTWCFRAELYTLFRIDKSRSAEVLVEVLGEHFEGVLGCDYFSAYRKYMRVFGVELQFCLAHLIRDVKYLMTLPEKKDQDYGRGLRDALRDLFAVIHRRDTLTPTAFEQALQAARENVLQQALEFVPDTKPSQNLAERFRKHGDAYFRFLTTPGIEPTNNLAEQAIRFVVIDRRITQGTRSETGRQWCERIWTVMATCTQQGRSVFEFLYETVLAQFGELPGPSLLPDTS